MRFGVLLAVTAALWVQPASAADLGYQFELSGTVSGTTYYPSGSFLPPGPFTKTFSFLTPSNNAFGEYLQFADTGSTRTFLFSVGPSFGGPGSYNGSFQLDQLTGNYSPIRLEYIYYAGAAPCNSGLTVVCMQRGSTNNFAINQVAGPPAVPEPETWAMLIVGFSALGAALRRRRTSLRLASI